MKAKKVLAMLMASAMIMGTSVTAFAGNGVKPTENDSAIVTISGVTDTTATYEAYQIIDASYDSNGFTGYVWATGMTNAGEKVTNPDEAITDDKITKLAANPVGLTQFDSDPDTPGAQFNPKTDALTVGTWMIIVKPGVNDKTTIYNPMIVSVYYALDNTSGDSNRVAGSVDATSDWTLNEEGAYAKSSKIPSEKTVEDAENEVGEKPTFHLKGTVPSYAEDYYVNPVYKFTDTISNGLKYVLDDTSEKPKITVTIGTEGVSTVVSEVDPSNYTIEYDASKSNTFTVIFNETFIFGLADKPAADRAIDVEYQAEVTSDAITEVGENSFKIEYSNTPDTTTTAEEKKVYTYTFSLDGVLKKVGEGEEDSNGLDGATFALYRDYVDTDDDGNPDTLRDQFGSDYVTTDDFDIEFKGLDADRPYYLKEVAAPLGYSVNQNVYKIEFINLKYSDETPAKLLTYDVKVTNMTDNTVLVDGVEISYGEPLDESAASIANTKLSDLPSTGGIGTTIFTIGGCVIMVTAAGLYFATRKKEQN